MLRARSLESGTRGYGGNGNGGHGGNGFHAEQLGRRAINSPLLCCSAWDPLSPSSPFPFPPPSPLTPACHRANGGHGGNGFHAEQLGRRAINSPLLCCSAWDPLSPSSPFPFPPPSPLTPACHRANGGHGGIGFRAEQLGRRAINSPLLCCSAWDPLSPSSPFPFPPPSPLTPA